MQMLTNRMRAVAAAVAGAVALSAVTFTPAEARGRRGDALALAAVAGVFGTIVALAARDRTYGGPVYYDEPIYDGPVYGGPVYRGRVYAAPVYRGPGLAFYRGHHGHHGDHKHR
jgi:hypothetical protein